MAETIYIDAGPSDGPSGIIFERETKVVYTGLEVLTEEEGPFLVEVSRLCGVHFFPRGQAPRSRCMPCPIWRSSLRTAGADGSPQRQKEETDLCTTLTGIGPCVLYRTAIGYSFTR